MKIQDVKLGMLVIGGMFNLTYKIVKVKKTVVWCELTDGEIMRGGEMIPDVIIYKNILPNHLTPALLGEES